MARKPFDKTFPNAVLRDAYDEAAWERALYKLPALRKQVEAGLRLHPGFEALGQDLFATLFKYTYTPADTPEHQEGRLSVANRTLGWVRSAKDFALLRAETVLDEDRAAFGVSQILAHVERTLRNPALFSPEDLLQNFAMEEAEQDLEELLQQQETVEELLEQDPEASDKLQKAAESLKRDARRAELKVKKMRRVQGENLDGMPASVETGLRELTDALPQRMEDSEQALEEFSRQMGTGQGERSGAASLALGERLLGLEKLRRLAQMVGALRHFARSQRRAVMPRSGTEVHAIDRGRDLSRLLPSEVVALRHPARRKIFLRRFLEADLLQYAIRGKDRGARGPMVVCVDGSGSMQGDKELWAKGVCLTLMEIARRQKRHFRAVVFSGRNQDLRVFDLSPTPAPGQLVAPPVNVEDLMDFAEYFPRGGTDFQGPLDRALELLQEKDLRRGDIVLITDGEAHVNDAWRAKFLEEKKRLEFQLYGVLVDVDSHSPRTRTLRSLADKITSIKQLQAEDIKDLFLSV